MLSPATYDGYFDESGKLADRPIVAFAGFISTPKKWNRLSEEWVKTLQDFKVPNYKDYDRPVFHANKCAADKEQSHGDFKNLSQVERVELEKRLTLIIDKHIVFGICAAIYID